MILALIAALLVQDDLSTRLKELDPQVLPAEQPRMLGKDARTRIDAANRRESEAWAQIRSKAEWETYRDRRIAALRDSLGSRPPRPAKLNVRITRTLEGDGHRIENLVFESSPGLLVTANLYVPVPERKSMPGILIVHSHHNPKTQSELQDMGVTWARLGCYVLVMDQLGHGERRQHPFVDASSYPTPYRVTRQDYFFRYVVGLQLYLVGESLAGMMASDLMSGVDLLLDRRGIDSDKIILLGSVAGGGDPAAAIDPRITAAVPFNFGGPQPETKYPMPDDAETTFNYAGGGSWESTRNLRLSARDGFLPWVIVGSLAPRKLCYGHEFSWDRQRDPVWKRLEKIYGFYDAGPGLAAATGRGLLQGQPPEATHCNNIGPVHRQGIYPALEKWFQMAPPAKDAQDRRPAADLLCVTPEIKLTPARELFQNRIRQSASLRQDWAKLLGDLEPPAEIKATAAEPRKEGDVTIERITLEPEPGIVVPMILLVPAKDGKRPIVIAVAQGGKQEFLKKRSSEVAALLKGGAAVCLPDLRGTGETRPGDGRGRGSEATSIAATELMLGRTLVGLRLRDLRTVIRHLRGREALDAKRIALWGDTFATPNPPDRKFEMPLEVDGQPAPAEPLGALMALFGALYEDDVRAVLARGGLTSFRSILDSPFCAVPFDVIVPGALTVSDVGAIAAALAPRAVRIDASVDAWNRLAPEARAAEEPAMAWLLQALLR